MAFGDNESDTLLRNAWHEFCDDLKNAGDLVFGAHAPTASVTRADGFQYLSRLISLGLDLFLEYRDPTHPHLFRYFGPTRKLGGDNPDAVYLGCPIDGNETYRIGGNLGDAQYIVFTTLLTMPLTAAGGKRESMLFGRDLQTEWDGSFELFLGPNQQPGNWIKTTPGTTWVTIRQFFGDWEHEQPMNVRIERLGVVEQPPPQSPKEVADGLREAGRYVGSTATAWKDRMEQMLRIESHQPNMFYKPPFTSRDGVPGGGALACYWMIQPDEALLIELTPVEASFWNFELSSYWFTSTDYRYRLSSVNCKQAVLEEDGSLRIAIAHADPGIPNWLDTGGHCEGRVGSRWMLTDKLPIATTRLVKLGEIREMLPATARRITPEQRTQQLAHRLIGVQRRFRM